MTRLLLILAAAVLLVLPCAARADVTYPGEHPVSARVNALVAKANRYWDSQHVHGCHVVIVGAPDLGAATDTLKAWGRGDWATCKAWLSDNLLAAVSNRDAGSVVVMAQGCRAIFHEVGHARGLSHAATGVMAGAENKPPARELDYVPSLCLRWSLFAWRKSLKYAERTESLYFDMSREMKDARASLVRELSSAQAARL